MPTVTTKLQAMSHPTVVATINTLAEMADRIQEENARLKKPWVGLTDEEKADLVHELFAPCSKEASAALYLLTAHNNKLKEKNT